MDFKGVRVLVLDGYGRQVAIILKELHKLGCITTTLNCSKLDVGYTSRYPKKKILEPSVRYDLNELKRVLDREIPSGNYDVVFPMLEGSTDVLWANKELYQKYVKYACAGEEGFVNAYDKQLTMTLCQKNGINCPITKMDDETIEEFLSKVSFPLALKPRKGSGSRGFHKVDTKEQLLSLIESGEVKVEEYVIQEFINEGETHRVSYTFIDNDGNVKTSLMAKSTRPYPLVVGTNSLFQSCQMPEIAAQSEKLLKLMNWKGYASVCFIESDEDHIPKVMEINGRISASIKMSVLCGAHVVRQLMEMAYALPVTEYSRDYREDMRLRHFQADMMWFIKSPTRFKCKPFWFSPIRTSDVVFSWSDPIPWFAYTISCFARYKGEMEKRKR